MGYKVNTAAFVPVALAFTQGGLVTRPATALTQNDTDDLFDIPAGGAVVTGLWGVVSTAVAATASLTTKLVFTPTGGSPGDLCAATVITSDGIGTIWSLTTGVAADLLSAQQVGGTEIPNVTYGHLLHQPLFLPGGTIGTTTSNHDPGSGAATWSILCATLVETQTVTAA